MSGTGEMSRTSDDKSRERRREEAARWFVAFQHAEISGRLLKRWKKWESVPENREAFDAIERVWQLTDDESLIPPAEAQERATDNYDGSTPVAEWRSTRRGRSRFNIVSGSFIRTVGLVAMAATLVLALQSALPQYFNWNSARTSSAILETGIAEHKEIVFEDGTRIQLGAHSAVTANFTRHVRSVVLDRGEALFRVAHDAERPFQVSAGAGVITAVGTAFNVRRRPGDNVVVTVTEGVVEISPRSSGSAQQEDVAKIVGHATQRLARGQEVTYDTDGKLSPVRIAAPETLPASQDGRLRYHGEPLTQVIQDVNRYSFRQLILSDPAAGNLLYSGTVFERDIDEWIAGLERIYPELEIVPGNDGRIFIRTRGASEQAVR